MAQTRIFAGYHDIFLADPIAHIQEVNPSDPSLCKEDDEIYCHDSQVCISVTEPCGGECQSAKYTKLWARENVCVEHCQYPDDLLCGRECISKYDKCEGMCKDLYMECRWNYNNDTVKECLDMVYLCDGTIHCEDGSDESICPKCLLDTTQACD